MGKFDDLIEVYKTNMKEKLKISKIDGKLLHAAAKACGPSMYKADASKVACSDKDEMARVKKNFLIKKLGLKDSEKLDDGLKKVCKGMGSANRNKYRPIFYYLLAKEFKKGTALKG